MMISLSAVKAFDNPALDYMDKSLKKANIFVNETHFSRGHFVLFLYDQLIVKNAHTKKVIKRFLQRQYKRTLTFFIKRGTCK